MPLPKILVTTVLSVYKFWTFFYFNFFQMNYQWKKQQFYTIGCATFGHAVIVQYINV